MSNALAAPAGRRDTPDGSGLEAELHAFTGTPRAVAERLFALPRTVVGGRLCALLLEGDTRAHVQLFERAAAGDREGPVAAWEGATLGELPSRVAALLTRPAQDGAEEGTGDGSGAVRAALRAHGEYRELGTVPCPPTARGAFGHPLRAFAADRSVRAFVVTVPG
jgi:hypothetical protein